MRRFCLIITYILLCSFLFTGCGAPKATSSAGVKDVDLSSLDTSGAEATIASLNVSAPGIDETRNDVAVIDYSYCSEGYVMVQYTAETEDGLKAQVRGPETIYTYTIRDKEWAAFPLSDGNGEYSVAIFDNIDGSKYALVLSADFEVILKDEFAPFLRPNQYVNFAEAPKAVALAAELAKDSSETLDTVASVYSYVTKNITYDYELAASVSEGYVPVLDRTLETGKGICFDYAALMTGMLRSCDIPCKLVIGYAGATYHAWINVYVDGQGWVDNVVYFDGTSWSLMDPTFASAGNSANSFIGDGSNYSAKYFY